VTVESTIETGSPVSMRIAGAELVGEHRAREREDRADDDEPGDPGREAMKPPVRQRGALSYRRDRRHPRRPDRGEEAREQGDAHPDGE